MYNIILDDKEIYVKIINKRKIQNITLSVKEGKIIVVKPYYTSINHVKDIITKNKIQILKHVSNTSSKVNFENGDKLLYLGKEYYLDIVYIEDKKSSIDICNQNITIYINKDNANKENIKEMYKSLLKNTSKEILDKKLKEISNFTNIRYVNYKLRYMTTRWGSCVSTKKTLNFNTKIAMLPGRVIDSIIVHELCHILEPNHQKAFWELVYNYIPDYDECNNWLKENLDLINI